MTQSPVLERDIDAGARPSLSRIWSDLLMTRAITPETDFFAAGGHSLLATQLLARVEREFGIKIPLPVFFRDPTLGALTAAIQAEPPARKFQFDRVARLGRGTAKPVYAVVHSNGAFFPLGHEVGSQHPFVALQAADRRTGGRLPDTIEAIAEGYVRQLRIVEPTGPYVLLGWCLAGNVAYEAAQQLRAAGQEVAAVVMVDTWNPAYLAKMGRLRRQVAERSYGWQIILGDFAKVLRGKVTLRAFLGNRHAVRRLVRAPASGPASASAAAYLAQQKFDEDLLAQLHAAAQRYQPRPYDGRVLRIRSSEEPRGFGLDRKYGWGSLVGEGLQQVTVPGDHLTIFVEPSIHILTRHVRDATT
jgi:thioesterase domain-containing protein/acyl carrier protein